MDNISCPNLTDQLYNKTDPSVDTINSLVHVVETVNGFVYTFIIPVICFFGILTNIINIVVFSNKEMSDITYKYLRVNAIMNIIYLSITFFLFMGRCGSYCTINTTYIGAFYMYFFYTYLKGIVSVL